MIPLLQQARCCHDGSLFLSWQLTGSSYTALPHGNDPTMLFSSFTSSVFILLPWTYRDKQCLPKCAIITHYTRQVCFCFFCFTGCYSCCCYCCFFFFYRPFELLAEFFFKFFIFFALSVCSVTFFSSETDFDMEPEVEAQYGALLSAALHTHTHTHYERKRDTHEQVCT